MKQLLDHQTWLEFYEYKVSKGFETYDDLKEFIEKKQYLSVTFSYPKKVCLSKQHSTKKRIVYTYSKEENYVLKLLTYLLQRKYDFLFADNLYSFRPCIGAKEAIYRLTQTKNISQKWGYKVDISDYFNSVNITMMLDQLQRIISNDESQFIKSLLENPYVYENGKLIEETKGIMAGTPISTFLANVYLNDLDHHFKNKIYARYSDDIIIFSDSKEELESDVQYIHSFLEKMQLNINPNKEVWYEPNGKWTFLGVSYQQGIIDVAEVSVLKLKAKMRRKARALIRWQAKKGISRINGAKAFIRVFNEKLFENPKEHELTWVRWYFPMINTVESLKEIDHYAQQCIRYIVTGRHNKSSYNFTYEEMKELGYQSLVHHYYKST